VAEMPPTALTAKANATRRRLLDAGREVFERLGYDATSIADIVDAAAVSRGTFYVYFDSKQQVFRTLVDELIADIRSIQRMAAPTDAPGATRIEAAVRDYLTWWRENARLMAVFEQAAVYEEDMRALRLEMRRNSSHSGMVFIRRLQRDGVLPAEVDVEYTATALTCMLERFAYLWFVLGEDVDTERAVRAVTDLWWRSIGGATEGPAAETAPRQSSAGRSARTPAASKRSTSPAASPRRSARTA
jgi:AcrR family transcriptional regulator